MRARVWGALAMAVGLALGSPTRAAPANDAGGVSGAARGDGRSVVDEAGAGGRWEEGERAEARGRAGDPAGFSECARIFGELAASLGDAHARTPAALWNTARCAEADRRPGEALGLMARIVERHPRSEFVEAALQRLAGISLALLRFEEAATWSERRAELYPAGAGVMEGLEMALTMRGALGQAKAARRDLERAEQLFGRTAPEAVAGIVWRAGAMARTDAERAAHAEAYLRRYGEVGGIDRAIVAAVRLAMIEASASCPSGLVTGLCVGPPAKGRGGGPRRCAEATAPRPRPRIAKKVEAVRRRLGGVEAAMRQPVRAPEDDPRRAADLVEAVAMARLLALDLELEEYLAVEMPTGLRMAVDASASGAQARRQEAAREASIRRMREFIREIEGRRSALARGYRAIVGEKGSVPARVAAAHRLALLDEHLADQLGSAEVPRELGDTGAQASYCRMLDEVAAAPRESAKAAYVYCAERAALFHHPTEASRACEAALTRVDRRAWPPLLEFVGEARPRGELPPRAEGVRLEAEEVEVGEAVGEAVGEGDGVVSMDVRWDR